MGYKQSSHQAIFGLDELINLQNNLNAAPQANATLIGTSGNRMKRCLVNTTYRVKHSFLNVSKFVRKISAKADDDDFRLNEIKAF